MIVLLIAGCGASYDASTGLSPVRILDLSDGFDFAATIERGEVLALDLNQPVRSGHTLVGASFDPAVLRLERYLERDGASARYLFTGMENGLTDVLIKMEPREGGEAVVYKRISVTVGGRSTLF